MMWWAALHYKHNLPYLSLLHAILPQHAAAPLSFHITPRSNTPAIACNEGLSAIYKGVDRQKANVPCRICLPAPPLRISELFSFIRGQFIMGQ